MKTFKSRYALAALLIAATSCFDDSYHGAFVWGLDDTIPIPVNVAVGVPVSPVAKGYGLVDGLEDFDSHNIYVYAFNAEESADFTVTSASDPTVCLVDASVDSPSSREGKQARLSSSSAYAVWTGDDTPFYQTGDYKSVRNRFFAYHIDTLAPTAIHRTRDSIAVDLHIDGAQDIMAAIGKVAEGVDDPDSLFSFSYYSARKGIVPVFQMEHMLARLDFVITPGEQKGHPKTIVLDSLSVLCPPDVRLTVAHKDTLNHPVRILSGNKEYLPLTERGGAPLLKDHYTLVTPTPEGQVPPVISVGSSLLVPPMDRIEGVTRMQDSAEGMQDGYVSAFEISYPGGFLAGHRYEVRFTVYGVMYIDVNVTLVDWETGGEIDLTDDPDNPGFEQEILSLN